MSIPIPAKNLDFPDKDTLITYETNWKSTALNLNVLILLEENLRIGDSPAKEWCLISVRTTEDINHV